MAAPETEYLSPLSKEPEIKQLPGFPRLKPAYILKLIVGASRPVGTVVSGSTLVHMEANTGSITTAEGYEDVVEAEVEYGSDSLIIDPDHEHARPNVTFLARTKDGAILNCGYTAVALVNSFLGELLKGSHDVKTTAFGISSSVHTFQTGEAKYKHLENKSFVGNGRFIINHDPFSITVESRISEVIPSSDAE